MAPEVNEPGCSSSQSPSDNTLARVTTVSSEAEGSGEDASKSSSRISAGSTEPESLLSRLKAADRSVLCCKRSVAINQPRKRPNKSSATGPSSVTPLQRAREFSSESIGISADKLFCRACREELSLSKK